MWLFLIRVAIFIAISFLLNKKKGNSNNVVAGQRDPNSVSRAAETTPVSIAIGTVETTGNIVWDFDEPSKQIIQKIKTGGFFGLFQNTEKVNAGFEYYMGMRINLSQASTLSPVKLLKWKVGGEDLYINTTNGSFSGSVNNKTFLGDYENGPGGYVGNFTFYEGSDNQVADPYLISKLGSNVPKYNRKSHFIWKSGYYGNSETPNAWSFVIKRILHNNWSDSSKDEINGSVNPACYIYDLLTNEDYGLNLSDSQIDLVNFNEIHEKLYEEGIGISEIITSDIDVASKLNQIFDIIDGQFNTNTDKIQIRLNRADYNIEDLEVFDKDKIINISNDSTGSLTTIVNEVKVKFTDINNNFKERYAFAQNNGVIFERQRVETTILDYLMVTSPAVANMIANRELIPLTTPLRKCKLSVSYAENYLSVGDVIILHYPDEDYNNMVMRITEVDYGNIKNSVINLSVVQDQFGVNLQLFNSESSNSYTPPDYTALPANLKFIEAPYYFNNAETNNKILTYATRPNGFHQNFELHMKQFSESEFTYQSVSQAFTPEGNINSNITTLSNSITLTNNIDVGVVQNKTSDNLKNGYNVALITEGSKVEFINFQNISLSGSVYTLTNINRALFDTKPENFTTAAKIYFISYGFCLNNSETYEYLTSVQMKLLTKTVRRTLDINDAPQISYLMGRRKILPILVSNLKINDNNYEENITIGNEDLELTYSNRDKKNDSIQNYNDNVVTNNDSNIFRIRIYDNTTSTLLKDFTTSSLSYIFTDEKSLNSGNYFTSLRVRIQTKKGSLVSLYEYDIIVNR